ncbi:hypothetical protein CHCC5025_1189 [Bacillus licheniformis]|nr:hypothetical protein BSSX_p0035 [Bacillus subtilis]TWJ48187.1 hypothetical protein CHCC5025_1189 [Bacillus licheniformis]TWK70873.1 hypothetical protein CHCC20342_2540 [Bacillus licheniformis]TWM95785.1 hypothetical protein CHCC14596_4288 [Bacillus licheniformis]
MVIVPIISLLVLMASLFGYKTQFSNHFYQYKKKKPAD